jgi:hypothetical protein
VTDENDGGQLFVTEAGDGTQARWYVFGRTIRVAGIILPNGTPQVFENMPTLGECFDLMPRELWDKIRIEYECSDSYRKP